jgi:hypothetical protein
MSTRQIIESVIVAVVAVIAVNHISVLQQITGGKAS